MGGMPCTSTYPHLATFLPLPLDPPARGVNQWLRVSALDIRPYLLAWAATE